MVRNLEWLKLKELLIINLFMIYKEILKILDVYNMNLLKKLRFFFIILISIYVI